MLNSIQIRNYVLIKNLDISFREGFSVLTGQTGAGKSIILGALNLLMGQRAETKVIAEGSDKCTVEGHFNITGYGLGELFAENLLDYDESDTIFRREVLASGKSRSFINDTPVSLALLKEIGGHLIDIHSQHQNLLLGTESFQTTVTDTIAGNESILRKYRETYSRYRKSLARLEQLKKETEESLREREYLQYQLDELDNARLSEDEQQELESEQDMLTHAEEIKASLFQAGELLEGEAGGAVDTVRHALQQLRTASRNLHSATPIAERLESCLIELRDIDSEIRNADEQTTFDPGRLETVSERLDLLYSLQKKHHCDSVKQLIEYAETLRGRLASIESAQDETESLQKEIENLYSNTIELAGELSETRRKAAETTENEISRMLVPLGISGARFKVALTKKDEPDTNGMDQICFLFSANQGNQLQELSSTASGGELSRVMLSVKSLMAGARNLPTIIFDEIDTGVSGAVAEKMALMMRDMCTGGRQVIAISHLPQIAAKSDAHYLVFKEEGADATHTYISELNREQRITEIARMMSGASITEAAMDNARALIDN